MSESGNTPILVSDVGSMPLEVAREEFIKSAEESQTLAHYTGYGGIYERMASFEKRVVDGLADKMRAGVDVPSYPQFRDMNRMFLDLVTHRGRMIPEVHAIRSRLREVKGVRLKICITGPHTLSTLTPYKTPESITELGSALAEITANSIFKRRDGEVALLSIDEPVFGLVDDPQLDLGKPCRDALRGAWEEICHAAKSKGVETMMHLHSTADRLIWEVPSLDIISSHVDDPIYKPTTKKLMAETGKRLSVGVAVTSYDDLLRNSGHTPEQMGDVWTKIRRRELEPTTYLEDPQVVAKRLRRAVEVFGEENIPYAGPECGLGGHPTYTCALTYLERVAAAIKSCH